MRQRLIVFLFVCLKLLRFWASDNSCSIWYGTKQAEAAAGLIKEKRKGHDLI